MKISSFALAFLSFPSCSRAQVFNLGNRRPEGVFIPKGDNVPAPLRNSALVGSLYFGGITAVDLVSGEASIIVPSVDFGSRLIAGVSYEDGMIIAAGAAGQAGSGPPPMVHVFNSTNGETMAECILPDGSTFANDVAVIGDTAYITDSFINFLHSINLTSIQQSGDCGLSTTELPAELFISTDGNFHGNGIRPFKEGLLIANSILGAVYYWNPATTSTGESGELTDFISEGLAPSADGLCFSPDGTILYVVENMMDRVSAWKVDEEDLTLLGYISSPDYETATTCDTLGDKIWVVNARFNTIGLISEGEA